MFRKPFRIVILTFPGLKAWFYPLWMQSSFKSDFWNTHKKGILDRDPPLKPDYEYLWTQSSFGMCVRSGNARWSHAWVKGSISAVGTTYYLAVCRSCSRSGRWLQCLRTHVVQITNPIRKWIVIRNGFGNMIRSFVNRPIIGYTRFWHEGFSLILIVLEWRYFSS